MKLKILAKSGLLSFFSVAMLFAGINMAMAATTMNVNTFSDVTNATDGFCSLREAIASANSNASSGVVAGECAAVSAPYTINLPSSTAYVLSSALPTITTTSAITIQKTVGQTGNAVLDGNTNDRILSISANSNVTSNFVTFLNGSANFGGAIANLGNLTINNGEFNGNEATLSAGAVSNNGNAVLVIDNTIFEGNVVTDGPGGAIFNSSHASLTITNSAFTDNASHDVSSINIEGTGGAISHFSDLDLNISNTTFDTNSADVSGGAIFIASGSLTITNSTTFTDNNSPDGGAIFIDAGTANISDATFTSNIATTDGGAILTKGAITLTRDTFNSNSAGNGGGAVYSLGGAMTISENTYDANTSDFLGGGAVLNEGAISTITTSTFHDNQGGLNHSDIGGAVLNKSNSTAAGNLTVSKSVFFNNSINGDGGAIGNLGTIAHPAQLLVVNDTFSTNFATNGGGGVGTRIHSVSTITNSTFNANSGSVNLGTTINNGPTSTPGTTNLKNTIIVNDSSGFSNCSSSVTNDGNNIQFDGGNGCGGIPVATSDPLNGNTLQNNGGLTDTIALPVGSEAIDGGDNTICNGSAVGGVDQRGFSPRVGGLSGTNCDIGAFEFNAVSPFSTLAIIPATLPNGTVGTSYSQLLTGTGGSNGATYSFILANGTSLPAGLTLSSAGLISGMPTTVVTAAPFSIRVQDGVNPSVIQQFALTIVAAPVIPVTPVPVTPVTPVTPVNNGGSSGSGSGCIDCGNSGTTPVVPGTTGFNGYTDLPKTDVDYPAFEYLYNQGIITGNPDGSVDPEGKLQRDQAAKIALKTFHKEFNANDDSCLKMNPFPDVTLADWSAQYICYGVKKGVITGYLGFADKGFYRPSRTVNWAEFSLLVARNFTDLPNINSYSYSTVPTGQWYSGSARYFLNHKLATTFIPFQVITRREVAQVLYKLSLEK